MTSSIISRLFSRHLVVVAITDRGATMKRTILLVVVALLAGAVIGGFSARALYAQQQGLTRTPLEQKDLVGIDGKEAIMLSVELAPGAQSGRHYHPGTEIAYVLSGTGVLEVEGQSPIAHFMVPPKQIHNGKNTGSTPLKLVVVAIHPKGEPATVPVQ